MYRVALIQNQSEMSHYSYADAREFLSKYDEYSIYLYTAENIENLCADIYEGRIDSIIIASHATNDITIFGALFTKSFAEALLVLFSRNGGVLILHQLRLGEHALENVQDGELSFLPPEICKITALARCVGESPLEGNVVPNDNSHSSYLLNFPNHIDVSKLAAESLDNIGLKGLYWHYWTNIDAGIWDIVLEDSIHDDSRVLVASTKESYSARVVLSSLTLDWQKQNDFFENLVIYAVEGRHHIAYIKCEEDSSIDVRYFNERIKSRNMSSSLYTLPDSGALLKRNLSNNAHTILVLTNSASQKIPSEINSIIDSQKSDGKIKVITIQNESFQVSGRECDELKTLYILEMEAINDLLTGYIDGSFWSTIESLQVFERIEQSNEKLKPQMLRATFDKIAIHDRNGSYDGVFGASCALLWIRAKYRGAKHNETLATLKWLTECYRNYDAPSQMHFLSTVLESGCFSLLSEDQVREELRAILRAINIKLISEVNAIMCLKCTILLDDVDTTKCIIDRLISMQGNNLWVDVTTTANIVIQMLDARQSLSELENYPLRELDRSLFLAVTEIQKRAASNKITARLWDRKIGNNLICLEALLKFEKLIELPIAEMIDSISIYSKSNVDIISIQSGLSVLSEFSTQLADAKKENNALNKQIQLKNIEWRKYRTSRIASYLLALLFATSIYILVVLIMYIANIKNAQTQVSFITWAFDKAEIHFAFIGILLAIAIPAFPKNLSGRIDKKNNKLEENDEQQSDF